MTHRIVIALALAFWGWYWIVQSLLGPFNSDDTFFLHIFWMLKGGARQYIDFYSYHLPTYFALVTPLLPGDGSLSFAWLLRGLSVLIVAGYAAMVRPALWPFMLAFVVFGRMVEIRPDTFALLLFNAACFLILKDRKHLLWAAALSGLALLFSARAVIMMVGMGPLLLWFARNDRRALGWMAALGAAFILALLATALSDRAWFELVIRSVYIDTIGLFPRMPLAERFLEIERISLVAMIVVALTASMIKLRRDGSERALIVAVSCSTQLLLILVDPLPFGYVYGWAMIPTLAGLSIAAKLIDGTDRPLAYGAFASALGLLALAFSFQVRKGAPPVDSYARLSLEAPLAADAIAALDTPRLVALMLKPGGPWNQLAVREELCRRIDGKVAAHFWNQPICLRDAMHDWIGQTWTTADMERVMSGDAPELIIWGEQTPWPRRLLKSYSVYPGFAIRKP